MNEYTTTFKLFRELVSIKRAQWFSVWLFFASVCVILSLSCYAGIVAGKQINTISQSLATQLHSENKLIEKIVSSFDKHIDNDFYYSLNLKRNVMIRVSTLVHNKSVNESSFDCPASQKYHDYLMNLLKLKQKPTVTGLFMFAGEHGLGKSYASYQLGQALSRFANTIVVSVPMNTFGDINEVGHIIERIENSMYEKCYVVWTFDELDSYILDNRHDLRDKTITQFAEYTGFVKNENRLLVFTMNNAEMLMHDYWNDEQEIIQNYTHYKYKDDFQKALTYTGLHTQTFLQQGQLSRLYSFLGNKQFKFEKFNFEKAQSFVKHYLNDKNIVYNNVTENVLFQTDDRDTKLYSVRKLKIAMDEIINENK
ncbi:hypothetical protein QKV36_gp050 [Erannis ankeraria nucleopolyhedrovirus]|uniref:hypothetical protein n=1 Tax=Erannis ankeraria nucleopolyhedrovirus TaxID=2913600 RepID=UPI00163D4367|nr:hypothetical protein QKV36_gp050 [Erannis ankeraria nucleopolyhedrovirus]UJZ88998.1 hypothetical protein Erangp050 [Erannis ankeraria nucleopolyhedrovirus]